MAHYSQKRGQIMKRLHVERTFNVGPELLWELVVDPVHYSFWADLTREGAGFRGDWTKGSNIRFVVEHEDGTESGMLSEVVASQWPEFISIRHIGVIMNGIEDFDSPMAQTWTPAAENYCFIPQEDGTCLFVNEQDLPEDHYDAFKADWETYFDLMEERLATSEDIGKAITIREQSSHSAKEIWSRLVTPEKVMTWNFASDDWYCPKARNHLEVGGKFHYEMAAKDGSMSFDYWGTYTHIEEPNELRYVLGDGRKVRIQITEKPYGCVIEEYFEAEEDENLNLQRQGWQSILKNLAK